MKRALAAAALCLVAAPALAQSCAIPVGRYVAAYERAHLAKQDRFERVRAWMAAFDARGPQGALPELESVQVALLQEQDAVRAVLFVIGTDRRGCIADLDTKGKLYRDQARLVADLLRRSTVTLPHPDFLAEGKPDSLPRDPDQSVTPGGPFLQRVTPP